VEGVYQKADGSTGMGALEAGGLDEGKATAEAAWCEVERKCMQNIRWSTSTSRIINRGNKTV